MNMVDENNFKIIDKLVTNHFGLDSESIDFFREKLYNPDVDDFYKEVLGDSDDLRIKFPINDAFLEIIDRGWRLFKDSFTEFCNKTNISYLDFRANKIEVEKNILKLRKVLVDFYTEDKEEATKFVDRIWGNRRFDRPYKREIIRQIDYILEDIGRSSLPKKYNNYELVLSLNFADWFMCSTGESWTSCLSLQSQSAVAYWTGLPGIIGDKNRSIIYLTNGDKKTYNGIITDKFLFRTWSLIDNLDRINIVRFFPSEVLDSVSIREIINNNFVKIFKLDDRYKSKHKAHLLFHDNDNKPSCFIYQDKTKFLESQEIDKDFRGIDFGSHWWVKKYNPHHLYTDSIFNFDKGLDYLVNNNMKITDAILLHCSYCGKNFMGCDEEHKEVNGEIYCGSCINYLETCSVCETSFIHDGEEKTLGYNGDYICYSCSENIFFCPRCDSCTDNADSILIEDENIVICKNCFKANIDSYWQCSNCGRVNSKDTNFVYLEETNEYFHRTCLENVINRRQISLFDLGLGHGNYDERMSRYLNESFKYNLTTSPDYFFTTAGNNAASNTYSTAWTTSAWTDAYHIATTNS